MSRSNAPMGPPGARPPARRHPDDPYTNQPQGGQGGHWPGAAYPDPASVHGQQGQGYYFPQAPDQERNYAGGYAPPPAAGQQPPFDRYQAQPGFPPQAAQPPAHDPRAGQASWNQNDPRGYDLGSYMPQGGQGYPAAADAPPFQPHQDAGHYAPPQQGYGDNDADFDDAFADGDEPPRRSRRGLVIVSALVGAIGLGGGLAYTYKTFIASNSGSRAPLIRAAEAPSKVKPAEPGGRPFANTDKKLLNRLGEDGQPQTAGADPDSDDPNGPRKVRIIPITPGGAPAATASAPPRPGPPMIPLPGISVDVGGPMPGGPPPTARAQPPMQAPSPPAQARLGASPPPVARAAPPVEPVAPPRRIAELPPAADPPPRKAVPKTKEQAAPPPPPAVVATTGNGFVAVLSSQKSRMDALKAFADLQQKYGNVLQTKTPDVQEANLGEKGTWYRAVVGPPGSRDAAANLCTQLKTAGYSGCWVTAY